MGFVDGKNYRVQEPSDVDLQNAHYNGWLHSVLITGTLCYGCDGTLIWAKLNCPGSWNDGEMSFALQEKLADVRITVPGTGVAADTAFPASKGTRGRIVTPLKDGDLERAPERCRLGMLAMSNAITSLRQEPNGAWKVHLGVIGNCNCHCPLILPSEVGEFKTFTVFTTLEFDKRELVRFDPFYA
ncbi:Crossover junction endonuclease [Phytophthora nicotianae]|uniref:Crossover junction endonuclease n=1 Tax=Phytophthora nicotianae TaxID=4792 RepID=A0A0W8DT60_PHYNI|nr:Crossover junction endonuclease [Phytophthora nicotianae]